MHLCNSELVAVSNGRAALTDVAIPHQLDSIAEGLQYFWKLALAPCGPYLLLCILLFPVNEVSHIRTTLDDG